MSLKWIDNPTESASHKLWQLLVNEQGDVVATVERFAASMPTYANVYTPERKRRVVSLYDYDLKRVEPSVEEQDKCAREWCEQAARPN